MYKYEISSFLFSITVNVVTDELKISEMSAELLQLKQQLEHASIQTNETTSLRDEIKGSFLFINGSCVLMMRCNLNLLLIAKFIFNFIQYFLKSPRCSQQFIVK